MSLQGHIQSHTQHGITTITFYHPSSNSLPLGLLDDLAQAVHSAGNNDDTKVVILRSEGEGAFCAGANFNELMALNNEADGMRFFSGFAHVLNAMRKCPKFIVARIQGKCVGGGVGLAAGADIALACEAAEVKLSELAVGLGPFVVGPAIERKIGLSAFSQLAIDATVFRSAEWARRKGLFAELHTSIEAMDESLHRLTHVLAKSSETSMNDLKKVLWKGTEDWDELLAERAAISGRLVLTPEARAAIEKFKAK